jgi:hypothetical protein
MAVLAMPTPKEVTPETPAGDPCPLPLLRDALLNKLRIAAEQRRVKVLQEVIETLTELSRQ